MKISIFALSVLFTASTIFSAHASEQVAMPDPAVLDAIASDTNVSKELGALEPATGSNTPFGWPKVPKGGASGSFGGSPTGGPGVPTKQTGPGLGSPGGFR